jgi:hypothetical protein
LAHSASFESLDKNAPSKLGTKQLGGTETGDKFDVLDGALTAGNSELEIALSAISGTTVEAGATLDWAGNVAVIQNLQGAGTVTNSGAAQTMTLNGATNFSGAISGALSLVFDGDGSLSGVEVVHWRGDAQWAGHAGQHRHIRFGRQQQHRWHAGILVRQQWPV